MSQIRYTDEQVDEFIEIATEIGVGPAMRELGYPGSWHTAHRWLDERGIEVTVDTLKRKARRLGVFYGTKEKVVAAQSVIDRIMELLEQEHLNAEDINKIANALERAIKTMELVEGRATERKEQSNLDSTDLEIRRLLTEMQESNELREAELKGTEQ